MLVSVLTQNAQATKRKAILKGPFHSYLSHSYPFSSSLIIASDNQHSVWERDECKLWSLCDFW